MAQNVRFKNLSGSQSIFLNGVEITPRQTLLVDVQQTGAVAKQLFADIRRASRHGRIVVVGFS